MTVKVTLNCLVKSDIYEELVLFLQKNLPNVRGFEGCLKVCLFYDVQSSEMLIDEEWHSVSHHQTYIRTIDENGVLGELGRFLVKPPVIRYFQNMRI